MYLAYEGPFDKIRKVYFAKVVKKYNLQKKNLLDYGCGPGDMLLVARKLGVKTYGIDLFQRSVDMAKQRGLKVDLGDYRALSKKYKKGFFDAIFIQSVVEHMHEPITELSALKPYIKKGGYLIISSPTPSTYFWDDPTHVRPYTPKSFKTLGEILGMKIIEVNYVLAFLLGLKINTRLVYLILNILPISLGSNLIAVYKK